MARPAADSAGRRRGILLALSAALLVAGCAAPSTPGAAPAPTGSASQVASAWPSPTAVSPSPTTSPAATGSPAPTPTADAVVAAVPAAQWARIVAVGAWHTGCPVTRTDLRRVEVNFHGFDGAVHRGVLVVNADVAASVARIFTELFDRGFPIRRMQPIEVYGGDDNASMAADNTSAYNCRRAGQANAPATASPHANGRAVDVNPYENPWIDGRCQCFQPDSRYGTNRTGAGVITKGGVAWTAFAREGWIWQDNATIDYQHFDTGYPSRPLS